MDTVTLTSDELVSLDDSGDLVLIINSADQEESRSFLVASKALCLASPVFAALLGPEYKEGQQLHKGRQNTPDGALADKPVVHLEEDDIDAMDFILSNMHFKNDRIPTRFTALQIAAIAIQSDKYDLRATLTSWIQLWCHHERFPLYVDCPITNMGYGLLAAHLFRAPAMSAMASEYVHRLPVGFEKTWKQAPLLARLPDLITERLSSRITKAMQKMRLLLLSTLTKLLQSSYSRCPHALIPTSNPDSPAREFVEALTRMGVWPYMRPFERESLDKVVSILTQLPTALNHGCVSEGRGSCALYYDTAELPWAAEAIRARAREYGFEGFMAAHDDQQYEDEVDENMGHGDLFGLEDNHVTFPESTW